MIIIINFKSLLNMTLHWSENENLHNNIIVDILSFKRFLKIIRLLQLNDNKKFFI